MSHGLVKEEQHTTDMLVKLVDGVELGVTGWWNRDPTRSHGVDRLGSSNKVKLGTSVVIQWLRL